MDRVLLCLKVYLLEKGFSLDGMYLPWDKMVVLAKQIRVTSSMARISGTVGKRGDYPRGFYMFDIFLLLPWTFSSSHFLRATTATTTTKTASLVSLSVLASFFTSLFFLDGRRWKMRGWCPLVSSQIEIQARALKGDRE